MADVPAARPGAPGGLRGGDRFSLRATFSWRVTLGLGTAEGGVFNLLRMPLPWMLGSLLLTMAGTLLGLRLSGMAPRAGSLHGRGGRGRRLGNLKRGISRGRAGWRHAGRSHPNAAGRRLVVRQGLMCGLAEPEFDIHSFGTLRGRIAIRPCIPLGSRECAWVGASAVGASGTVRCAHSRAQPENLALTHC